MFLFIDPYICFVKVQFGKVILCFIFMHLHMYFSLNTDVKSSFRKSGVLLWADNRQMTNMEPKQ